VLRYLLVRLVTLPVVLWVIVTLSFFMIRLAPGTPFASEKALLPEIRENLEEFYGFGEPISKQYVRYLDNLRKGNLGYSTQKPMSINAIVARYLPNSVRLGLGAISIALLIGLTAGIVAGVRQNSLFDYGSMSVAMLGISLPTFVVGPMLVLIFALKLDWVDPAGWQKPSHMILPCITLGLPFASRIARLARAGMLEIINQDYVRTARAKGLRERRVVLVHALKGAMLPVVSFLGPATAALLTGSLVVEKIFAIPGLGKEFVDSALNRDYFLVLATVILYGSLLITFNLVVDVLYGFLDPRIRYT